ncbi:MAG: hypothetical protein ACP5G4_04655 [bacterium]
MSPLFFSMIAIIGVVYFAGWLINIGLWNTRKICLREPFFGFRYLLGFYS